MKQIIFLILCLAMCPGLLARDRAGLVTIDTSKVEILYFYRTIDTVKSETKELTDLLQIGKSFSSFSDYNAFLVDSIICSPNARNNPEYSPINVYNKYRSRSGYLEFDNLAESITVGNRYGGVNYNYEESKPNLQWELLDSVTNVCGYECAMARCNFRGRTWTAWYTEEIPLNMGPWKLGGLPGMILKANDATCHHFWEAMVIRNGDNPIKRDTCDAVRVSRKHFLKAEKDFAADPIKIFVANGVIREPTPRTGEKLKGKPGFYCPLELE